MKKVKDNQGLTMPGARRYLAMRQGGKKLGRIRKKLIKLLEPGLDLMEIEKAAKKLIKKAGAIPNFALVNDYGFATCLMVNEEVVHCRPQHRLLNKGDLVTIDVGLEWQGWQLDTADSTLVGGGDDRFISIGRQALKKAIAQARPGNRIGHLSQAIQSVIESAGYNPVKKFCGHGIGRQIHEEPQIFCFLSQPVEKTMVLKEGMALAIEVMMNEGASEVVISKDGWRSRTADGSRSLQLEHTVLVTKDDPEILTR